MDQRSPGSGGQADGEDQPGQFMEPVLIVKLISLGLYLLYLGNQCLGLGIGGSEVFVIKGAVRPFQSGSG